MPRRPLLLAALLSLIAAGAGAQVAQVPITALPAATTPLSGTEAVPIVQNGVTRQASTNAIGNASSTHGTVTSVNVSGGATGLTFTGGPVTAAGTMTEGGTLAVAHGGTGSTSQNFVDLTTTQVIAGIKTFTGQLIGKGTATNDSAASGYIGEYISSAIVQGSAVSVTTSTAADVTSIVLTAGDWDVSGMVDFYAAGTTTVTSVFGWTSTVSATFPTEPNAGSLGGFAASFTTGARQHVPIPRARYSLASTTTVYLSAYSAFGTSTMTAGGFIGARRVR